MALDRNEVALRFAVAIAGEYAMNTSGREMLTHAAFACADAFLAEAANRAPVAQVHLRFDSRGDVMHAADGAALVHEVGYGGRAADDCAWVMVRAESTDHAQRIVAAMLAAGRQVTP